MADAISVAPGVRIPPGALHVKSVRASGPGGQNVNKVASRVELAFDPHGVTGLDAAALSRLLAMAAKRLDAEGRVRVVSQESRDRFRNLETAREKARALVARALVAPKARRPTKATVASREKRLREKKRDAGVKTTRRAPRGED